MTKLQAINMQP
jgi:iron only hydrogenase large subunit-like protein